jgi:UDP-N-acetyl-D-glucosamine dehydrogenase
MLAVDRLNQKIKTKDVVIGVIGMGYVGIPLALAAFSNGLRVVGFDIDKSKIEKLKKGENYIKHLDPKLFKKMCDSDLFEASSDFDKLDRPDVLIICVPTPLTKQKEPDLQYVVSTTMSISAKLRKGQLVILESTTYPGTVDEVMKPVLEKTGLEFGKDFFLAFSPEREDPGRRDYSTTTTPKIVGGVDAKSTELSVNLYSLFIDNVVEVRNARTAEATKLMENIFRAVNIALVNEIKVIYDRMGIDIWEVLDAASTKPFGFMRFNPGPGWGGHCIPLDPFYLTWKAKEYGLTSTFIEHAGEINRRMPQFIAEKLVSALNEKKKPVKGSKVLMVGVAYKKDIDDPRESPAFELLEILEKMKADVSYHDPHIQFLPKMREWPDLPELTSVKLSAAVLKKYDAVVIVTDHSCIDYKEIQKHSSLIIDSRGVYRRGEKNVVKA